MQNISTNPLAVPSVAADTYDVRVSNRVRCTFGEASGTAGEIVYNTSISLDREHARNFAASILELLAKTEPGQTTPAAPPPANRQQRRAAKKAR